MVSSLPGMNSPSLLLKYLILMMCLLLCESFNAATMFGSGIQSLFSLQNSPAGSSIVSLLSSSFPVNPSSHPEKPEQRTLYGKPVADKSSVLESLFEINAKEYLADGDDSHQATVETKRQKEEENSLSSIFQNIDFLPLVKNNHRHTDVISPEDKPLLDYLDSMRGEAWSHFKSIIMMYVNSLDSPLLEGSKVKDSYPVKIMMKLLEMGDKINIVHLLGKKVNPDVSKFLIETLRHSAPEILGLKSITEGDISALMPAINKMINQFAWLSLRHIIDSLVVKVNDSFTNGELQKYISDLEATNPFAAKGLRFVLSLPTQIPRYDHTGEGRSFGRSRNLRPSSRDGFGHHDDGYGHHDDYGGYGQKDVGYGHKDVGYGHKDVGYGDYGSHAGGSYGHGGGYHMGIQLDPYLILAGIGTAALLAFVAFKVFTTAAPRKKRSFEDPNVVSRILNSIESEQGHHESDFLTDAEDVVDSVNVLWRKTTSSGSCTRCSLFELFLDKMQNHDSLKMILLSVFAQMLGTEKPGQLLDEMAARHLAGNELICDQTNQHSCDLRK